MEQEKIMTIKEVATSLDVSEDSVLRAVKEFYPELVRNGKTTFINEAQATAIKLKIVSHHNRRSNVNFKTGYLYLLNMVGTSFYKIGVTKDVSKRIKSLSTGCPLVLKEVFSSGVLINNALKKESLILKKYSCLKNTGEWISANDEQAQLIVNDMVLLQQGKDINE